MEKASHRWKRLSKHPSVKFRRKGTNLPLPLLWPLTWKSVKELPSNFEMKGYLRQIGDNLRGTITNSSWEPLGKLTQMKWIPSWSQIKTISFETGSYHHQLPRWSLSKSLSKSRLLASEPSQELRLTQPRSPEPRGSSRCLYQSSLRQHSPPSHSRLTGRLEAHLQVCITSPMTKKATCHPHWGTLWKSVRWFMLSPWQAGEGTQLASEEEDLVMLNDPNKGWSRGFKHPAGHPHKWKTFIFMNFMNLTLWTYEPNAKFI